MFTTKCLHLYSRRFTFMNNRLQQFLELENLSPARLADMLGVQRSGMSHILSGRNKPGYDFIYKLLTKFPALSADWFLTGKGKPYKEMNSLAYQNEKNYSGNNDKNISPTSQNFTQYDGRNLLSNGQNLTQLDGRNFSNDGKNPALASDKNSSANGYNRNESYQINNNYQNINNQSESNLNNNNISSLINPKNNEDLSEGNLFEPIKDFDFDDLNSELIFGENELSGRENGVSEGENGKSDFLEQIGSNGQNSAYIANSEQVMPKNSDSYRNENQIKGENRGIGGKKRRVKRVIIFYNDGSFDELFPNKG